MSLFIPDYLRKHQKKELLQKQQEVAEYRKKMEGVASKVIKILVENNLKVDDFTSIVNIINQRFSQTFSQKEIKSLIQEYAQRQEKKNLFKNR